MRPPCDILLTFAQSGGKVMDCCHLPLGRLSRGGTVTGAKAFEFHSRDGQPSLAWDGIVALFDGS